MTYGGRPGLNGQQGWPDDNEGWGAPQVPPQWRSGHAQRPAWYGLQDGPRVAGRNGHQGFKPETVQQGYAPGPPAPRLPPEWPAQPGQQGFGPPSGQPPYRAPQPPGRPPRGGRSWPARHKALTGILALVALIIVIGAAQSGKPHSPAGNGKTAGLTTSPTATKPPSHQATHTAAAAQPAQPQQTQPAAPATSPAPISSAPVPTRHAAAAAVPLTSAAPSSAASTSAAPSSAAPSSAASADCQPLTKGGNCYEPGEYCRAADHGVTGVAGDGETITCENNDGWHWEPS